MDALSNTWSDAARAASMAVRRAKAAARGGGASSGGGGRKGWSDAARAAALAVRRKKAAERKRQEAERRAAGGQTNAPAQKEEAWDAERVAREAEWEEIKKRARQREEDLLRRQAAAAERDGTEWRGRWTTRGTDGIMHDPHWGETSPDAPYGYEEGTGRPRQEPLYDQYGAPIIPMKKLSWYGMPLTRWKRLQKENREKSKEAEKIFGRWGSRKKFFEQHPEATEEEWKDESKRRTKLREWKKRKEMEEMEL
ncbi:MAG: hypothetical protein PHR35_18135 [Kiritimatiellae bacterium]|nr:hypothetical protein [Kiritimatiellia bacterium]